MISPSSSLTRTGKFEDKLKAKARLEALGYQVTFGQHILENDLLESSSINSRLSDFHAAFSDPNVKAVLCTIGGFNSNELLPYIDWNIVKIILKFSVDFLISLFFTKRFSLKLA